MSYFFKRSYYSYIDKREKDVDELFFIKHCKRFFKSFFIHPDDWKVCVNGKYKECKLCEKYVDINCYFHCEKCNRCNLEFVVHCEKCDKCHDKLVCMRSG